MGPRCPWCAAPNTVHDGPTADLLPSDGDVSVCYRCRRPGMFVTHPGGGLSIRKPTEEERAKIEAHPHVRAALAVLHGPLSPTAVVRRWRETLP